MPKYTFELNGKNVSVDAPADLSVLWTLRDKMGMTGLKYGCGINVCKACTIHVDDAEPFNACVTDVEQIDGRRITTIEGLAKKGKLTPVQQAWIDQDVAQCGYCQPGQIMVATALLMKTETPTDADIDTIDNVCRCGSYFRIREAIKRSVEIMKKDGVDAMGAPVTVKAGGAAAGSAAAPVAAEAALPTTGASSAATGAAAALAVGAAAVTKVAHGLVPGVATS